MSRYRLVKQLHFLADLPGRPDVVVTLQRWDSYAAKTPKSVCVITHNGVQDSRRLCVGDRDLEYLAGVFKQTAVQHAEDTLSEEAAADAVVRRGGPNLKWCHRGDCGSPVPYASAVCADGHPTESVGRVEFLAVTQRHPVLTVVTGGQNRG